MSMLTICIPVLPGRTERMREFAAELMGPRRQQFEESRARLGVHERSYLQQSPDGDVVILTLEGDEPAEAFGQFGMMPDEFTDWFVECVREVHGLDLRAAMPGHLPELIAEAGAVVRVPEQSAPVEVQTGSETSPVT